MIAPLASIHGTHVSPIAFVHLPMIVDIFFVYFGGLWLGEKMSLYYRTKKRNCQYHNPVEPDQKSCYSSQSTRNCETAEILFLFFNYSSAASALSAVKKYFEGWAIIQKNGPAGK
jgi:hypothetical protein